MSRHFFQYLIIQFVNSVVNVYQFVKYIIMMAAACCPDDSWPALTDTPYACQGVVETLDESSGFKVYKVGAPNSKCIIWNYDIYGFEGGRTREMADFVASQGNIACFMPK